MFLNTEIAQKFVRGPYLIYSTIWEKTFGGQENKLIPYFKKLFLKQLKDAVEQQIAVKQFAEHERDKLQKEVDKLNEESIERDRELIQLRRIKEKHEEEKQSLQARLEL